MDDFRDLDWSLVLGRRRPRWRRWPAGRAELWAWCFGVALAVAVWAAAWWTA